MNNKPRKYGFWGLEWDKRDNGSLYYSTKQKKWIPEEEYICESFPCVIYPSWCMCRSLKAAKRHLRKHDEIPVGTRFRLISRYVGCDTFITKKGRRK